MSNLKFNVIEDSWIPVQYSGGHTDEVGIRTIFAKAHEMSDISPDNPLLKVSLFRFLTAFLSDAYELETKDDRLDLFDEGHFSETVLDQYIERCASRYGTSFDLFDEKAPFMTSVYDRSIDGDPEKDAKCALCDAGQLDLTLPHGNTRLFNGHRYDDQFPGYTPAEFIRQLITRCNFSKEGAGGSMPAGTFYWVSAINGLPSSTFPLFFLPKTGSLFEDLIMCMRAKTESGETSLNDVPAAWNDRRPIDGRKIKGNGNVKGDLTTEVSYVSGLTLQPVRVVIVPSDDGLIHQCYMSTGRKLDKSVTWIDPFCSYNIITVKKTGQVFRTVKGTNMAVSGWRNILLVSNLNEENYRIQPTSIIPVDEKKKVVNVIAIGGVLKKKAAIHALYYDETSVPVSLITDHKKANRLRADVDLIDKIRSVDTVKILVKAMVRVENRGEMVKEDRKNPFVQSVARNLDVEYLSEVDRLIGEQYIKELDASDADSDDWDNEMNEKLRDYMKTIIFESANTITDTNPAKFHMLNIFAAKTKYLKDAFSILKKYTKGVM